MLWQMNRVMLWQMNRVSTHNHITSLFWYDFTKYNNISYSTLYQKNCSDWLGMRVSEGGTIEKRQRCLIQASDFMCILKLFLSAKNIKGCKFVCYSQGRKLNFLCARTIRYKSAVVWEGARVETSDSCVFECLLLTFVS